MNTYEKQREALAGAQECLEKMVGCDMHRYYRDAQTCDGQTSTGECGKMARCKVIFQIRSVLSAPARPCDTMPWRDAWAKWRSEVHPAPPETYKECYDSTTAFMDWYMSEEGGERKKVEL